MFTLVQLFPLISFAFSAAVVEIRNNDRFEYYVPTPEENLLRENRDFWTGEAAAFLKKNLNIEEFKNRVAKNVVVMIGDGMGISTITATRIYRGQRSFGKSGEDHRLSYDDFPNVALVKTYNVDMQVPDSAGTATALFTGVKTRYEALGVDVTAKRTEPDPLVYENSKLESIMTWAQRANKDTGIITTTRITHATPAATYSQIHHRDWECDSKVPQEFRPFVKDIAHQLIEQAPGNNFKVILGGGYQALGYITTDQSDGECVRGDGRNLTQTWVDNHKDLNAAFVSNNLQLAEVGDVDYLLGLFYPNHVPYELLRNRTADGTPSLTEMTKKGLQVLKKSENGFVLMIEGGRIDHGHHDNYVRLALEESAEFDRAVALVVEETGPDTLIIVTADHSHTLTINGYSKRGNDILGYAVDDDEDTKPGLTLAYANGPGFAYHYRPNETSILGPWVDPRNDTNRLNDFKYQHLATFETDSETHGGEDVGIFATGPGSHLIRGVMEQSYVAHVISYAACIGPNANMNPNCKSSSSAAHFTYKLSFVLFVTILCVMVIL